MRLAPEYSSLTLVGSLSSVSVQKISEMNTPEVQFEAEAVRLASLSARERDVSTLVTQGLTNKQIGERLSIGPTAVRSHLDTIFRKLQLTSRFELIIICYRHGLVVPPSSTHSRAASALGDPTRDPGSDC
jgi:DNA-binding NarL/FixJ family response regulator